MYLFNRTRQAKADRILEAMPSAVSIAEKVTQITGIDIYVWSYRFGAPMGTIMWSCRLDSRAQLFEANEKMMADATYIDMAMSMAELYEGPTVDGLFRVISGTPSPEPRDFIEITQATMANGKYAEAMQFGVDMQQYVADELGTPTMFGAMQHGGFADVGWIQGFETIDEVDAAAEWNMTNEGYHERVNSAADLFVPGSGQQALVARLR